MNQQFNRVYVAALILASQLLLALSPAGAAETISLPGEWRFALDARNEGVAWYQRMVHIPDDWRGRAVELFLERTRMTMAWLDDTRVGAQDALGVLFEARVEKGKLLVCTLDLLHKKESPVARQMLHSLLKYSQSGFNPKSVLPMETVNAIFAPANHERRKNPDGSYSDFFDRKDSTK